MAPPKLPPPLTLRLLDDIDAPSIFPAAFILLALTFPPKTPSCFMSRLPRPVIFWFVCNAPSINALPFEFNCPSVYRFPIDLVCPDTVRFFPILASVPTLILPLISAFFFAIKSPSVLILPFASMVAATINLPNTS
ncbi:hypothetical protein D3C85_1588220 [compost metagenome]